MQWIEVCIKTTSQAIELVGERLTMLGFDSFIMDDQDEFPNRVRRGRCPHRPKGTNEFAEDFRKNGLFCRVDVGIDPYA